MRVLLRRGGGDGGAMGGDKGVMGVMDGDKGFVVEGVSRAAICSLYLAGWSCFSPSSGLAVAKYTFRSTPTVPDEGQ